MCKSLHFQIRRLSQIRPYLTDAAANKLAVSFILSRMDYCNSLLNGLPGVKIAKLQRIQNSAACRSKRDCITSLLKALHWLPVKARIEYEVASLSYQYLHSNSMPSYLRDLLHLHVSSRPLRSQDALLLTVPRFSLDSYGKRAFSVSGPQTWNSLPFHIRQADSFESFKTALITYLFHEVLS